MKAHRNLTRHHIRSKGPAAISLMIVSEFERAANRSVHRDNVIHCYARARELMGILETMSLPAAISRRLKPIFARSSEQELLAEKRLTPLFVQKCSLEIAATFNWAASALSSQYSTQDIAK